MPRDTNGNTQPLPGTIVSTGDTILPSQHNPMVNDVYAMITQSLSRDGQGGMRAILDMSGFKVINVGTANLDSDAVSLGQSKANGVPIATVVDFAGSNAPDKWLLCFGQSISRTEYSSLFSIIGTTYGSGDGSTTFNLPDLRGRVLAGKDNMGGANANRLGTFSGFTVASNLGESGGSEVVSLTRAQLPTDQITPQGTVNVQADIPYAPNSGGAPGSGWLSAGGSTAVRIIQSIFNGTPFQLGSGQSHLNVQPTIVLNKIIKASL